MKKINRKNQEGFTLIEVLISTFILSSAIIGIMQLYVYTSRLGELAGDKIIVLNSIQNKMDEIRNASFGTIATTYPTGTTFALPTQFTGNGIITLDTSNSSVYDVTVAATWTNKRGRGLTITLESRIALR